MSESWRGGLDSYITREPDPAQASVFARPQPCPECGRRPDEPDQEQVIAALRVALAECVEAARIATQILNETGNACPAAAIGLAAERARHVLARTAP